MKNLHKNTNTAKRYKIIRIAFCFIIFLMFLLFVLKYINSRPAIYRENIPQNYTLRDFDVLCNKLDSSYMNLNQTIKYNDIDFISLKPNFKSKIKQAYSSNKKDLTSQQVCGLYNDILDNLYESNVKIVDKYTFNKILLQENKNEIINNLSAKRYQNLENIFPSKNFRALDVKEYKDAIYVKISDFDSVNVDKDAEIFTNILKKYKKKSKIIVDLRDNESENLDYALNVVIKPLLKSSINVDFKVANKTHPIISKKLLAKNNITFKTTNYSSNLKIKDNSKDIKYITTFNLKVNASNTNERDVYILQNKNTKNSADFVCQIANRTRFASTVGETTSGNGLNIVHTYISLPNTGFLVQLPLGQGINEDGSTNEEEGTNPVIKLDDSDEIVKHLLSQIN